MPEQNSGYFKRSWALLTKDHGWIKPVLVLSVASLVPFVGLLGVHGYALEWARLTAWGVDAAPKQKGVRVGECLKSGWRALLAGIGYTLVGMLLSNLLQTIFGGGFFVQLLAMVISMVAGVISSVAALRATIYQEVGAGYQFERMGDMIRADYQGLINILLIEMAMSLVVVLAITGLVMMTILPILMGTALGMSSSQLYTLETLDSMAVRLIFFEVVDAFAALAPWFAVIAFIAAFGMTLVMLIGTTAIGLWMRQFNVPAWGASNDPLPVPGALPAAGASTQVSYAGQQSYGQQYQQGYVPQQAPQAQAYQQPVTQQPTAQPIPQPVVVPAPQSSERVVERIDLTSTPAAAEPTPDRLTEQPTTVMASQPATEAPTQTIAPTASPVQKTQVKSRANAWFDATASAAAAQGEQPAQSAAPVATEPPKTPETPSQTTNAWFDATASAGLNGTDSQE